MTDPDQRDADVTRLTPMTPAERARRYRERKRDAATAGLVTPETVTPVTPDVTPVTPMMPAVGMTKSERDELAKITKTRGRVAKARVDTVKAELLADIEAKLSAEFSRYDEMWDDAVKVAEQAVADANAHVQRVCAERGIPASLRPSLGSHFYPRGENMDPRRRTELRMLARTRVDHLAKSAKLEIEAQEAETLTALYAGGLTSASAQEFLGMMPDPRALMPMIEVAELTSG
jgi:hypothetical protein